MSYMQSNYLRYNVLRERTLSQHLHVGAKETVGRFHDDRSFMTTEGEFTSG